MISRPSALLYLKSQYEQLATLVEMEQIDTSSGFGQVIDEALLSLSVPFSALETAVVDDTKVRGYRALLRYHALRHFESRLLHMVSWSVVGTTAAAAQALNIQLVQVRAQLAEAREECAWLGFPVGVPPVSTGYTSTVQYPRRHRDYIDYDCSEYRR